MLGTSLHLKALVSLEASAESLRSLAGQSAVLQSLGDKNDVQGVPRRRNSLKH